MSYIQSIRALCEAKQIPIGKLEMLCGFPQGTLARWARIVPQIDKFEKVADVLGCSIDELCGRPVPENTVYIEKAARALNAEYTDDDFMMLQAFHTLPDADRLQVMNLLLRLKFQKSGDSK